MSDVAMGVHARWDRALTAQLTRGWVLAALALLFVPVTAAAPARNGEDARDLRPLSVDDLFALRDVSEPQVSPDGAWIAYTVTTRDLEKDRVRNQIWMVPGGGGEAVPVTADTRSATRPRWSPDGKFLAFLAAEGEEGAEQVWTLFRQGGDAVKRSEVIQGVTAYEWSPDARRVVLVIKDPTPRQAARAAAGASEQPEPEQTAPPWVITRRQFKQDYVGYLDSRRTHLYVLELASGELRQVTAGDYDDSEPAWSPDGRFLAFTSNRSADPDANEDTDIWRVSVDSPEQALVRISRGEGPDSSPAWSPDGQWITFVSAPDTAALVYATPHLAVAQSTGGEVQLLTAALDRPVANPRFSPDGRHVYFLAEDERERYLARIRRGGGAIEKVTQGPRVVDEYTIGTDGAIALLLGQPNRPFEVYLLAGGRLLQRSHVNERVLAELALGELAPVEFASGDGTRIQGFLLTPSGYERGRRYPAILYIHGGPVAQYDYRFDFEAQLLAAAGYLVILPNPRGSSGRGQAFARAIWQGWGQKDYEDVSAAVDYAIEQGLADPGRLGVGGWSYGGMLTNHVITRTDRFDAAITGASATLYVANYGHDMWQTWWEGELGLPWKNRQIWEALSPFNRVERIVTPTLIVGGEHDWNVPIVNSEQLYMALRRLGVTTELVVYPGEFHLIQTPSYQKDLYQRFLDWYARFLGP